MAGSSAGEGRLWPWEQDLGPGVWGPGQGSALLSAGDLGWREAAPPGVLVVACAGARPGPLREDKWDTPLTLCHVEEMLVKGSGAEPSTQHAMGWCIRFLSLL